MRKIDESLSHRVRNPKETKMCTYIVAQVKGNDALMMSE